VSVTMHAIDFAPRQIQIKTKPDPDNGSTEAPDTATVSILADGNLRVDKLSETGNSSS